MLRRPMVGRWRSKIERAIAAPRMAKSINWRASAPIVAPTSSTMLSLRRFGQIAAIAGRSIAAMVRRQNLDIAINAPVLPAETQTSASPFLTASIAFHMDDFAGGLQPRHRVEQGIDGFLSPEDDEADVGPPLRNFHQARQHDGRAVV